ncbi:FAD-dependent oxidoreductase [Paenibacillus sp. Marseille-P2973]|uniref:FAD-dependent oxidoreductase n=1 Tax=Paenibacillus sp. Marseille-P2973 TaxID=1871032 RepID=UPI001B389A38|nr:FAD-dependent oxidoreductase [Paenibacillus sp. Marseille-P2973]MBQ4901795.1 FAD-dependent oxidoreductase [Paenibacillus sp. Marseille-P2973]
MKMNAKKVGFLLLGLLMVLSVFGCSKSETAKNSGAEAASASGKYKPGTYTAKAAGNNGDVTVEVVFDENSIISVTVKDNSETEGLSDKALERIPQQIVDGQTLAVDMVSGASNSSKAILAAVEDCVKQAGGDVDALKVAAVTEDKPHQENELTTDVVVIGGGGTGLAAAGSAFENGAKVIVLEKMGTLGGSTALSGGAIGATGTRFQKEQGIEDSPESWLKLWKERQSTSNPDGKYPDYDRVSKFMDDAVDTTHWLVDYMNHKYVNVAGFGVDPVARLHFPEKSGATIIANMEKTLNDKGIDILTETKATELLTDDKGNVVGVKAENAEGTLTVHAKKVIIATGGFARSEELMKRFLPEFVEVMDVSASAAGSTGDGIVMAEKLGAALYEDPWIIGLGIAARVPELRVLEWDPTKMYVNEQGERYMNENSHYAVVTNKAADNGQVWVVIDSSEANADVIKSIEGQLPNDEIAVGNTVKELAAAMQVPEAALIKTMDTFNEGVASGQDLFKKDAKMLVSVKKGPFYAFKFYPRTMGTFGGVKVDENYRVLKEDGSVINNLYAGGEAANRYLYNQVYMTGSAVQYALTSGRLSGEHAAKAAIDGE